MASLIWAFLFSAMFVTSSTCYIEKFENLIVRFLRALIFLAHGFGNNLLMLQQKRF